MGFGRQIVVGIGGHFKEEVARCLGYFACIGADDIDGISPELRPEAHGVEHAFGECEDGLPFVVVENNDVFHEPFGGIGWEDIGGGIERRIVIDCPFGLSVDEVLPEEGDVVVSGFEIVPIDANVSENFPSVSWTPWGKFAIRLKFIFIDVEDIEFSSFFEDNIDEIACIGEGSKDGGQDAVAFKIEEGCDGLRVFFLEGSDDFVAIARAFFVVIEGIDGVVDGEYAVDMCEGIHIGANEKFAVR